MSDEINQQRRSLIGGALVAGTAMSGALTTALAKPAGGGSPAIDVHQFGTQQVISGDPRVYGSVYVGTNGRGVLYGDPAW